MTPERSGVRGSQAAGWVSGRQRGRVSGRKSMRLRHVSQFARCPHGRADAEAESSGAPGGPPARGNAETQGMGRGDTGDGERRPEQRPRVSSQPPRCAHCRLCGTVHFARRPTRPESQPAWFRLSRHLGRRHFAVAAVRDRGPPARDPLAPDQNRPRDYDAAGAPAVSSVNPVTMACPGALFVRAAPTANKPTFAPTQFPEQAWNNGPIGHTAPPGSR